MQRHSVAETTTQQQPLSDATLAALQAMVLKAIEKYPDEQARIERGAALTAQGHVHILPDGSASVQSGTWPDVWYTVRHECVCPDWRLAPVGRCKHRWARTLLRRAYDHQFRLPVATADPQQPYAFPAYTTFAATYAGTQHPQGNGIAHVIDGGFYFLPDGAEDGFDCLYAEVALGPGLE